MEKRMNHSSQVSAKAISALLGVVVLLNGASALAQSSGRKVVDPSKGPHARFTKLVGEITDASNQWRGNAFVVGADGCHIATNFHVAFSNGRDPKTGDTILVDDVDTNRVVNFSYDLDSKTGKFKNKMKAKVVEFGNYDAESTVGLVGDMVVLKLDRCLGKDFAGPNLDRPEHKKFVPKCNLMTTSTLRNTQGRSDVFVEEGCRANERTPIAGVIVTNCSADYGMSGSMILEKCEGSDWKLVGMTTRGLKDSAPGSYALYTTVLTPFIESVIGDQSVAISPVTQERKPQSKDQDETTALVSPSSTTPRTVVR